MADNLVRPRGSFGTAKRQIAGVLMRATAMYNGMDGDKATYASPNPPLPTFLGLIQGTSTAHQAVTQRTIGAAATRDATRDLLWTAMEAERIYIQSVADANPSRSISILQNGGLIVIGVNSLAKGLLTLRNGAASGTVECFANVGLLLSALATKRSQHRFFNWRYTLDGGKSYAGLPSTTHPKTTITGLAPQAVVGVQVNLNIATGPGEWSPMVAIVVH
jgi:hypothetical protein